MIWATPVAWALALLAALPLIAHLWSRKRPAALPFPTLRFLRAASPVSRRLRRVQDWPLLLLRLAIVVVVCAAAAGPTLDARWRQQAWRSRLHRVIVVDADVAGATASAAVNDMRKDVASSTVLGPAEIADVFDDAIAQAERSAADRRTELVVVWSGSRTDARGHGRGRHSGSCRCSTRADRRWHQGAWKRRIESADRRHRHTDIGRGSSSIASCRPGHTWPASVSDAHSTALGSAECRRATHHGTGHVPAARTRRVLRALDEMSADVRLREAGERSLRSEASPIVARRRRPQRSWRVPPAARCCCAGGPRAGAWSSIWTRCRDRH